MWNSNKSRKYLKNYDKNEILIIEKGKILITSYSGLPMFNIVQ